LDTDEKSHPNGSSFSLLAQLLEPEQIKLLAELLIEIIDDTGWGDVKIVVAEKRVVRLKAEKSY
jgi:hypothetical protein